MNKSELIQELNAKFPGLSADDVRLSVDIILQAISNQLAKGERVEIRGFGSFSINHRPPRIGRNPKTGARVEVPAKAVPCFKAGLELRERVNRPVKIEHKLAA